MPVTGIAEAVFARVAVRPPRPARRRPRAAGPDGAVLEGAAAERFADDVEQALYASKIVAYAQGFDQIQAGATEYGWDDRPRRGGLDLARRLHHPRPLPRPRSPPPTAADPALPTLLVDSAFAEALAGAQDAWRRVVAVAAQLGIPAPGFSTALAYYDALRAERLPAALIQGQRDFFGAHTYRRTDREGTFHTRWAEEGRPQEER